MYIIQNRSIDEYFNLTHNIKQLNYKTKQNRLPTQNDINIHKLFVSLFNDCNPKTFNANFRGWALCYRAGLERGGICRAAFERLAWRL